MRRSYLAGNWKMNLSIEEAKSLVADLAKGVSNTDNRVMVAPPFTMLSAVKEAITNSGAPIVLAAQNMSDSESGAHTGEVAPSMLKEVGVTSVILGHSERRSIYGEDDAFINRKVKLALAHGLEVILCVGETLEERKSGKLESVLDTQIEGGLAGITDLSQVVIAYEPVWAIGTGETATPEDANNVHTYIREKVAKLYSPEVAENLIIQYGGSVKPDNVKDLMAMEHIDGALVGGASLKAENFVTICCYNSL